MTIEQALRAARARLADPNEAELILGWVLHRDTTYLINHADRRLGWWRRYKFQRLINRRRQGWPLAYLTRTRWFYGRQFTVRHGIFIPEPETELLVDLAMEEFRASEYPHAPTPMIVDVATGTGCIAITLAAELGAEVIASDVSAQALKIAKKNARRHGVADLITFLRGSLLEPLGKSRLVRARHASPPTQTPLIIVANLPYLPAEHSMEYTRHEPSGALYGGGDDGLALIKRLIYECRDEARLVSAIIIEVDPRNAVLAKRYIDDQLPQGYSTLHHDLADRPRVVIWLSPPPGFRHPRQPRP